VGGGCHQKWRESEGAGEDKGVWIPAVSKTRLVFWSKIWWLVVEETGRGLGFSLDRLPPIENNPSYVVTHTVTIDQDSAF